MKGLTSSEAQQRVNTLSKGDKNELLFSEFSINYNNLPPMHRKGTVIVWEVADGQACQMSDVSSSLCESGQHSDEVDQSRHSSAAKKRRTLAVLHVDMNDTFWLERPHLLNGTK